MNKKIIIIILFFLLLPLISLAQEKPDSVFYAKAFVKEIKETRMEEEINGIKQIAYKQEVILKILSGELKNREFTFINEITNNPLDIKLSQGDKIIVNIEKYKDQEHKIFIVDYYRLPGLAALIVIFLLFLIIIGGRQGFKTVLSLIFSIFLIFYILIPKILTGSNPLILAFLISIFITLIALLFISGWQKKTLIAILGTLGGLIIAVLISFLFTKLTYLTGLSTEEARTLFYKYPKIDPRGVFFSGIIIAALGAVMDVAMSIASSLNEIKSATQKISFAKLFKAGIQVGKDIMGTMSNTLIFAYVGVSLPLLLLYKDFGSTYRNFINLNFVADEIIRSIGGSIGLIAVIPITALIGAFLYTKDKK